ncbi:MAG: class I SAM-dependent methyltransferase [Rhodobacteraceae bacterium]|nr:class I SAM-dependent methyltransferase [Paracoccaceae bacterium]
MSVRLTLALESGGLALPGSGTIRAVLPAPGADLSALPRDRVQVVQPFRPHFDHFAQTGLDTVPEADGPCAAAILFLPRAKARARALVHDICATCTGPVVIDGFKTDGIESLLRDIRKKVPVAGALAKAHGKLFWFDADARAFADWAAPAETVVEGFHTAPGVFSADGIDAGSRLLREALGGHVGRHVADLGAGWGYLSAGLVADDRLERLDLVEADHAALDCARANVTDPRARFHWADATAWRPDAAPDAVVMNPPFHNGRAADPSLGRAFIDAAARMLAPGGALWLVANRHLPYETALTPRFAECREVAGDGRFKILRAARPSRPRR